MRRKTRNRRRMKKLTIKRRRCLTKIYGGMTNEELMDMIRKEVNVLFPEIDPKNILIHDLFIEIKKVPITFTHCKESTTHLFSPTVHLDFKEKTMKIALLAPCSPLSGVEMLRRFISLAKRLQFTSIFLSDESEIYLHPSMYGRMECMLPLPYFRILLKGESWYQSFGFTSKENASDREYNERIRSMPFRDFVEEIVNREKSNDDLLTHLLKTFSNLNADMRVSDAMQSIVTAVNQLGAETCDRPEFALLKRLVDGCALVDEDGQPLIRYAYKNRVLQLTTHNI